MGWHKTLAGHWNRTKSFIHQGYRTLGKWAGEVERGAGIGKKIFASIAPILEDFGQHDAISHGMKAIQGYDQLRGQVMDADHYARGHANRIAQADLFS